MTPLALPSHNTILTGPPGIEPLPATKNGVSWVTHWRPSDEELRMLNAGHPVRLELLAEGHPPVSVGVGQ